MFKRFSTEEVSSISKVKSSVARSIRARLIEAYPLLEEVIEEVMPKKTPLHAAKAPDNVMIYVVDGQGMCFTNRNNDIFPTLRLLHRCPAVMDRWVVDKGAIRFVMGGANVMCPGLTHPNARMDVDVPLGRPVAIYAEGKENAMAIGTTLMTRGDITSKNKGLAVETLHFLNDGLWCTTDFE